MNDVVAADGRKRVFHTLDGMRGVAAVAVFLRHIPLTARWPIPGSYLAVDLFFALSGFVLAYSNEHRLGGLAAARRFMIQRLIRLYPLYILGAIACALLGVKGGAALGFALAVLFLPSPATPGEVSLGALYPFNFPAWSLFYELVANAAYSLVVRWLNRRVLIALLVVSGVVLAAEGFHRGGLDLGSNYATKAGGVIRVTFSFFMGVAIFRLWKAGWRIPRIPSLVLAIAPVPLFLVPGYRPVVDLIEVVAIFPLLILAGASNDPAGRVATRVLVVSGEISYPLYVLQAALMLLGARLAPWAIGEGAPDSATPAVLAFIVLSTAVAWLVYRAYDMPVRARLGAWVRRRQGYARSPGAA